MWLNLHDFAFRVSFLCSNFLRFHVWIDELNIIIEAKQFFLLFWGGFLALLWLTNFVVDSISFCLDMLDSLQDSPRAWNILIHSLKQLVINLDQVPMFLANLDVSVVIFLELFQENQISNMLHVRIQFFIFDCFQVFELINFCCLGLLLQLLQDR